VVFLGVLVQADESVMAIIKAIDKDRSGFILQELDMQTCLIQPDKIEELERLVKAVSAPITNPSVTSL
jgi:hypothetical protein